MKKRSESKPSMAARKAAKKLSPEAWAALEQKTIRSNPKTGLGALQERGARGIDRAARTVLTYGMPKKN